MIFVYVAIASEFGAPGVLFFLSESAIAIVVLELFNYIAHYGLVRDRPLEGRQPSLDSYSWNSSNELANFLIFNMGRHSDHHRRPNVSYHVLSVITGTPELPFGYAGSILLALVPPLWCRVMDPKVFQLKSLELPRVIARAD
jgi:alkane 1-monooxygenase